MATDIPRHDTFEMQYPTAAMRTEPEPRFIPAEEYGYKKRAGQLRLSDELARLSALHDMKHAATAEEREAAHDDAINLHRHMGYFDQENQTAHSDAKRSIGAWALDKVQSAAQVVVNNMHTF